MAEAAGAVIRVIRGRKRSHDRRRPCTVFIDQEVAGEVGPGKVLDLPVSPGRHDVRVAVDFEHSREWSVVLGGGDVIKLVCRVHEMGMSGALVDLFLFDPADPRAHLLPSPDGGPRDMATRRVVSRGGQVFSVWAHRSGYLRSLHPEGGAGGGDEFLVELAFIILVLPVLGLLRWVRHRLLFDRGWSVGVVRDRRFLWPKKVRLERYPDEATARRRAVEVIAEVEGWRV